MRKLIAPLSLMAALLGAAPAAQSEVVQATPAGFELAQAITIDKPADRVWATLIAPQRWWDKEHTYSGDAANLYLDTQATGCFCERLPGGGGVEHARIVYLEPGKALRLSGGLGPLQIEGVSGSLTFTLEGEGSGATKVKLSYVVGGYIRGGSETIAALADKVLAIQMARLKEAAETAKAEEPPAEK